MKAEFPPRAQRLLARLAAREDAGRRPSPCPVDIAELEAADLVARGPDDSWCVTEAGTAYLARRRAAADGAEIDPFLAQHVGAEATVIEQEHGRSRVIVDPAESPLAWLARRRGRDGAPLIAPEQFLAGERLRAEFTRAQMTPRVTSNWDATVTGRRRGASGPNSLADTVIAARQRVRAALDAAGPEFAGLLIDVCCFLKGLEEVERERRWPARSAKVVLQLGLDRLARHYGFQPEARGPSSSPLRTWAAQGATFAVEGE
jgi:hypothetical protein